MSEGGNVKVLNETGGGGGGGGGQDQDVDSVAVSQRLQKAMLKMTGKFLDEATGKVNYASLRSSDEFKEYCELTGQLRSVDVEKLDEKEKLAFFINVYNALTVHSLTEIQGVRSIDSALDVPAFWSSHAYRIGPFVFSLDDVEHGILRVNKAHPSTGRPVMAKDDSRLRYRVSDLEPRIHFALNCGALSCPMVRVYNSANLEVALEGATRSYLTQEVEIKDDVVRLPEILSWYLDDFAPDQLGMLRWIKTYLEEKDQVTLDALTAAGGSAGPKVEFFYNWSLNKL
ncbi:uncharacterized protein LOC122265773 [Penaeus japonicus]|uniref:uncharacterized protein LOC122265773 n=1 Tax=Penaeus japonicus TaxID=27405 RepID=UPI001C710C67|nr:uncharacterized protein LOC122265773 [Penaeus japonicus]XP_042891128.1 uncharacterized protein LOC122265773 [Penaeus japonicus]XP_042891129.1 uncharacterized protein LOC122265773 [Penaeus japonicus]